MSNETVLKTADAGVLMDGPSSKVAPAVATDSGKTTAAPKPTGLQRLVSLDAYRGFTMILMASSGLGFATVARNLRVVENGVVVTPEPAFWKFLAFQTDHVAWTGCSLWDLIQPSFMFMVGVALPYSIAARRSKGDGFGLLLFHTIWRSLLLILLAVFLSSAWDKRTSWIFTNVLAQIGLGYPILFAIAWLRPRWQISIAVGILIATWAVFAIYPLPPADFNYASVGLPKDWVPLDGFAAHWNKNTNLAHHFDVWLLNLFPREKPFAFNNGGYATLNFVPALVTMIFGLLAGELLRSDRSQMTKVKWMVGVGFGMLVVGSILDVLGICPSVKRIWTPSWAIFSSGWTFLALAAFYFVIDIKGWKAWAFPCVVVGMNSIAMYVMAQLCKPFISGSIKIHAGPNIFESFGKPYAPIFEFSVFLLIIWLVTYWMYQRKLFLKI